MKKAIILLSGGLDSATTLAIARSQGFECYALSFDYGQVHRAELNASIRVVESLGAVDHKTIKIDLSSFGGSALTDKAIPVPTEATEGIPITYVPARNTVFLSMGLAWAEVIGADDLFIGVNAVDYSGYPDCRTAFIKAFEKTANLATKAADDGNRFHIHTPLIDLSKADIIKAGTELGVDYGLTVSCYSADEGGRACGECDACRFRKEGFSQASIADPTRYI